MCVRIYIYYICICVYTMCVMLQLYPQSLRVAWYPNIIDVDTSTWGWNLKTSGNMFDITWVAVGLHYLLDMYLWSQYSTCRRHRACCQWWYFCSLCSSPHTSGWSAVSLKPLAAVQVLDPKTPRFPSRWCCSWCRCGPENAAGTPHRCTGWWELLCPVATGQSRSHAPHCPGTRDACRPAGAIRCVQGGTATHDVQTCSEYPIF